MGLDQFRVEFYITTQEEKGLQSQVEELLKSHVLVSTAGDHTEYTFVESGPEYDPIQLPPPDAAERLYTTDGLLETEQYGMSTQLVLRSPDAVPHCLSVRLNWGRAYFKSVHNTDEELAANAITVADTVEAVYEVLAPLFVWGYIPSPVGPWNPTLETTVERVTDGYVDALGWLTVFPPAAVRRYGRESLLSAPAWGIRELDDGAIMLVTGPTPTDFGAVEETAHEIAEHLGMDLDPASLPGDCS